MIQTTATTPRVFPPDTTTRTVALGFYNSTSVLPGTTDLRLCGDVVVRANVVATGLRWIGSYIHSVEISRIDATVIDEHGNELRAADESDIKQLDLLKLTGEALWR